MKRLFFLFISVTLCYSTFSQTNKEKSLNEKDSLIQLVDTKQELNKYLEDLTLTEDQKKQISKSEEFLAARDARSRPDFKLTVEQKQDKIKGDRTFRNEAILNVLSVPQIKKLIFLQADKSGDIKKFTEYATQLDLKDYQISKIADLKLKYEKMLAQTADIKNEQEILKNRNNIFIEMQSEYSKVLSPAQMRELELKMSGKF